MAQALLVAGGHGGVEFEFGFALVGGAGFEAGDAEGFLYAGFAPDRVGFGGFGEHLGEELLGEFGVAEEGVEHFVEDADVLLAADHHGLEGGAQVVSAFDAHGLCGGDGEHGAAAVDRHTGAAQGPAEGGDVVGEFPASGVAQDHSFSACFLLGTSWWVACTSR
ncbi:MAG: hypothetical protein ACT6UU_24295 [Hydrogenophaga sp.]|uniref:hypothetical protein n=1 Tax=Hydrogenophaga sp. TaxID=1904254 RepID=UPI00403500A3